MDWAIDFAFNSVVLRDFSVHLYVLFFVRIQVYVIEIHFFSLFRQEKRFRAYEAWVLKFSVVFPDGFERQWISSFCEVESDLSTLAICEFVRDRVLSLLGAEKISIRRQ
jgi:hypothetical protein